MRALAAVAILLLCTLAMPAAAAGGERIGPHGTAPGDTAPASAPFQVAQDAEPAGEPARTELLFRESVKVSRYPEELQACLDRYPDGAFAALARSRLKRLGGTEEPPAAPATATSDDAPPGASSTPSAPAQHDDVYEPYKKMWVARRIATRDEKLAATFHAMV